jgi:HK97 family phage portal protein
MSLIRNLTRGALGLRADVSGTPAAWDDYWYRGLGFSSASGMRVDAESAKRIATVLACVNIIGRNIGMMPIKVYTEAPDGSKRLVDHHPLYDVLYSRPNAQQTAFEFKQMLQGHLELRGNAYAEIKPGPRGAVDQLLPLHPDRIHVERILPSGKLRYRYNDPLTNLTRNLLQEEVFHLRNFSDDGAVGQSTVAMACDFFGVALAQQDYIARFLKNDARPPIVFEGANFKTKIQEEEFLDGWQRRHTAENRGKAGLLPPGLTAKVLGITPNDQQLLDSRKFSRIEICSIFPVPPHMIGETEKTATYASVEQFNIMYAVHCILSRCVLWEQAIQRDLITNPRFFSKFSLAALLRGDTAARFAAYHTAIGDGWMCQDEARAFEDMNPIPGGAGRWFWRPVNWTRLDQAAVPASLPASTADDDTDDPGAGEPGTDTGTHDPSAEADPKIVRLQLQALATGVAERCVRREVAALYKMVERKANGYEVEQFYDGHAGFIAQAFNLDPAKLAPVKQAVFDRAGAVCSLLVSDDLAGAYDYIDRIAATEPLKLAALATGGKQ